MNKIVVTGSSGLIGGALVRSLKELGYDVVTVDSWDNPDVHLNDLFRWLSVEHEDVSHCIHLGANTNTLETDNDIFKKYNYGYSESLWYRCNRYRIPLIYASSAATYGDGSLGYSDSLHPKDLKPLNLYGHSKNEFDKFVLSHNHINDAPFWAGLKFFNVYGYNESHKGKMASMVYHAYNQVKEKECVRLFKWGNQIRDFIYVQDVVDVMIWMMKTMPESGIYNVGTGCGRTFNGLANSVFDTLNYPLEIDYFDMPEEIKSKYQSYTQADITKLRKAGYIAPFTSLENGVNQYIKQLEDAVAAKSV